MTGVPQAAATIHDVGHRCLVHDHGADHHVVGPAQVIVGQPIDVQVHQLELPVGGQQRGHGQQAQRREGGAFGDETQHMLEAPKRFRRGRIDKQNFHGRSRSQQGKQKTDVSEPARGIRSRRPTRQQAPRPGRVALHLVIRRRAFYRWAELPSMSGWLHSGPMIWPGAPNASGWLVWTWSWPARNAAASAGGIWASACTSIARRSVTVAFISCCRAIASGATHLGPCLGHSHVRIGLVDLQACPDVLSDINIRDIDRDNLKGRTRVQPPARARSWKCGRALPAPPCAWRQIRSRTRFPGPRGQ